MAVEDNTAAWQAHRIQCLELATTLRHKDTTALFKAADEIGLYILTRSGLECRQTNKAEAGS